MDLPLPSLPASPHRTRGRARVAARLPLSRLGWVGILAIFCFGGGTAADADDSPFSEAQQARLERFLPRTYAKLQDRKPVQIVALGDSVIRMWTPNQDRDKTILTFVYRFAEELSRAFFYPGGVRVINPVPGEPAKANDHLGQEILLENLALSGRCSLDALQRLTTDAFVNDPDLVVISYGINDVLLNVGLDVYRRSLERSVDLCRERGVDVVLLAPTIIRQSPGPTNYGLTRAHALVAREVAEEKGVFFADLGAIISRQTGVPTDLDAAEGIESYVDRLEWIYEFDPGEVDHTHVVPEVHQRVGRKIYVELLDGEAPPAYKLKASARILSPGEIGVKLSVTNQTALRQELYIGALAQRRNLIPVKSDHRLEIDAGDTEVVQLVYARHPKPGQEEKGDDDPIEYYPLELTDTLQRFSFILADAEQSGIRDVAAPLAPVAVKWITTQLLEVKNSIRLEWEFVQAGDRAVDATYRIELGSSRASGSVSLKPGERKRYFADFPFNPEPDLVRLKIPVNMSVEADGTSFVFNPYLEATRDLVLGEPIALSSVSEYGVAVATGRREPEAGRPSAVLRMDADENALYFICDFAGMDFVPIPGKPSFVADIGLDAREADRVRRFGFVNRIRVNAGHEDGPGETVNPRPGYFGEGYDLLIDPAYVRSVFKTRRDGVRRFELRVPRQYLYRHEWKLDDPNSVLGINVNFSVGHVKGDDDPHNPDYPPNQRFMLADSKLYAKDARSLATLRLTREPSALWSVRLY